MRVVCFCASLDAASYIATGRSIDFAPFRPGHISVMLPKYYLNTVRALYLPLQHYACRAGQYAQLVRHTSQADLEGVLTVLYNILHNEWPISSNIQVCNQMKIIRNPQAKLNPAHNAAYMCCTLLLGLLVKNQCTNQSIQLAQSPSNTFKQTG